MGEFGTPPRWVADLVERVCRSEGVDRRPVLEWTSTWRYGRPTALRPRRKGAFKWLAGVRYRRKTDLSCGWTFSSTGFGPYDTIQIWYGQSRRDQRTVVLHELSHWLTDDGHTKAFWETVWRLYMRYMPNTLDHCLDREERYRMEAVRAAQRLGVPGADKRIATYSRLDR